MIIIIVTKQPLAVRHSLTGYSTVLCSFRPKAVKNPTVTSLVGNGTMPSKGAPVAFLHAMKRIPFCCGRCGAKHPYGNARALLRSVPVRTKRASLKYGSCCLSSKCNPLFPFKCKLSCSAFRCKVPSLRGSGLRSSSVLGIHFGLGGAKGCRTARITRLCMRSGINSMMHPMGRLGHFGEIALTPNRSGAVAFRLPISRLTF